MPSKLLWIARQFGFDPVRSARALAALPRFWIQWRNLSKNYRGPCELQPCLHDYSASSGDSTSEYFLQDLYVAQKVFAAAPRRHIDVGSRVDGFVAHVASFRQIDVFDIRPNRNQLLGIHFHQADISSLNAVSICDSLSCLHALEHFGLGRYGDRVDLEAPTRGLESLARMLELGGRLYLSVPIGQPRIVFNAHRIFSPEDISHQAQQLGLRPAAFAYISNGSLYESTSMEADLARLSLQSYTLGIFTFERD